MDILLKIQCTKRIRRKMLCEPNYISYKCHVYIGRFTKFKYAQILETNNTVVVRDFEFFHQ